MTFDQLRQQVLDYCNLTSSDAQTRVGKAINRHYRRVTSQLGLEATRFVIRAATTVPGQVTVTFDEIEKIDRILDTTDSLSARLLTEVSLHDLRASQPGAAAATCWALQSTGAESVLVRLDTVPQTIYSLQADGWATLSDLSGADAPVFPESFHDILSWFVIAEELLKKEKGALASAYEQRAERLLSDLRFHLADSPTKDTRQRRTPGGIGGLGVGGSGGGGNLGGTAYTQTALLSFDRGPSQPPFSVVQPTATVVTNLDADKVDGLHATDVIAAATSAAAADVIPIDLATEVTGRAAFASLPTLPANTLAGRGSGSAGDIEPVALGAGLSMVGPVITANPTTPAGSAAEVQYRNAGAFGGDATFAFNSASKTLVVPLLDLSAAAGGQVVFPATANPSIATTTLDDYREGNWTPTLTTSSGSGQTYTTQHGRYVKVGKSVFVAGRVTLSGLGTLIGSVGIGGLPFAVENSIGFPGTLHVGYWSALTSAYVFLSALCVTNSTRADLYGAGAAATSLSQVSVSNLSSGTDLLFSGCYVANA